MVHSIHGQTRGRAGKTARSLDNACHAWALLQWGFVIKRRSIKCHEMLSTWCLEVFGICTVGKRGKLSWRTIVQSCFLTYWWLRCRSQAQRWRSWWVARPPGRCRQLPAARRRRRRLTEVCSSFTDNRSPWTALLSLTSDHVTQQVLDDETPSTRDD